MTSTLSSPISPARRLAERHGTPRPAPTLTAAVAAALALAPEHWTERVRYRADGRWTHLLAPEAAAAALPDPLHGALADLQIWLLSWLPGQGTPLHDHGSSTGAFAVTRGTLTERVVAEPRAGSPPPQSTAALSTGRVRHFGPHYVHQVHNLHDQPAVSVHVYTPRLTVMHTYRVDEGALVRTGTERAGVDW